MIKSIKGVYYIGIGEKAALEMNRSIETLKASNPGIEWAYRLLRSFMELTEKQESRLAKTKLYYLSPYEKTIYLDADTRVYHSLDPIFDILDDGWDIVITPSENQGDDLLWHLKPDERQETVFDVGCNPLQLQAGVFGFNRSGKVKRFFDLWQYEWLRYKDEDQGAFLRALYRNPLRVWLMGRPWNGGAVIAHKFGNCRRS